MLVVLLSFIFCFLSHRIEPQLIILLLSICISCLCRNLCLVFDWTKNVNIGNGGDEITCPTRRSRSIKSIVDSSQIGSADDTEGSMVPSYTTCFSTAFLRGHSSFSRKGLAFTRNESHLFHE